MVRKLCYYKEKIVQIYLYRVKRDTNKLAKRIGVRMGAECKILDNPVAVFGSEPWLIELGNHVEITAGCRFVTHEGGIWVARGLYKEWESFDKFAPIIVGNNVMIGMGSLIMPGITIGDNVIIGAHSVVTKDVPSNTIVAGCPAKKISDIQDFILKSKNDTVPTKFMNSNEKRSYLQKNRPDWFE